MLKIKKKFIENVDYKSDDYKLFCESVSTQIEPLFQKNKKKENGGHNRKVYEITSNTVPLLKYCPTFCPSFWFCPSFILGFKKT